MLELGVFPLIMLCASPIFIVTNTLLQHLTTSRRLKISFITCDDHRRAIGQQGGIEALFLSAGNAISRATSKQQSEKTTIQTPRHGGESRQRFVGHLFVCALVCICLCVYLSCICVCMHMYTWAPHIHICMYVCMYAPEYIV